MPAAWDMVCSKGMGAGSKSGNFPAKTPRTPIPAPPGRARGSLDRLATYIVAAYLAGAAR